MEGYEREELLMELVSTHYWKALKAELNEVSEGYLGRLLQPSKTLVDLVEKEALAGRLATLRDFTRLIEERADRYANQRRKERNQD